MLVQSCLQHRPHKLLCFTGVEHKERLTKQRMLLTNTHTHTDREGKHEWCFSDEVGVSAVNGSLSYLQTDGVQRIPLKLKSEAGMNTAPYHF